MEIYLAGKKEVIVREEILKNYSDIAGDINILESFDYLKRNKTFMPLAKHFGSFLLDSGAFAFMSGSQRGNYDWNKYIEDYAEFINKHDVKLFFELDIDSVVGLKKTEYLREKLEDLTGKKSIPVWHKNRGKDYFIKMCENYPYVAIGGFVTREIPRQTYEKAFPWFISNARKAGVKIHGLGYTSLKNLSKCHFDSVDSTAWLHGNMGGFAYKFNPSTGLMDKIKKEGCRFKTRELAVNNFIEWAKFQKYAKTHF